MKGFTRDGKFHPITDYKGVRKSRDQSSKTKGIVIRKNRNQDRIYAESYNRGQNIKVIGHGNDWILLLDRNIVGRAKTQEEIFEMYDKVNVQPETGSTNFFDPRIPLLNRNRKARDTTVDPAYGLLVANGYDDLKHNPNDPEVKKAYKIFVKETLQQARKLQKNGMKFQMEGYKDANAMFKDVEKNKNLLYRPSDNDYKGVEDHPMFQLTNIKNTNGDRMRVNDVFRAIHDINGHEKSKSQFTPEGELNSYISHKKLYSKEATRALFTETQGQGMWVNFNKKSGKKNRHAQKIGDFNQLDFAKQKAGIFPDEVIFG